MDGKRGELIFQGRYFRDTGFKVGENVGENLEQI
jgi:hypothetical protein